MKLCCYPRTAKISIITIMLLSTVTFVAVFLFNTSYASIVHSKSVQTSSKGDEDKSDGNFSNQEVGTYPDNDLNSSISNIEDYEELIKQGVGDRSFLYNGTKTGIALLSAFEYNAQVNVLIISEGNYGDKLYCRYFNKYMEEIGIAFKSVVFPQYTVYCTRRKGAAYISLSYTADGAYKLPVPIIDRTNPKPAYFFSVCLAPLYGEEPKWLQIAEFVEHYKIQGATHFYIYYGYTDSYSREIIDDYVRTGDAEVIVLHEPIDRSALRWQQVQLQECLQRARGHSQWVAMVDLDERLTPTYYSGTIKEYLENIKNETIGGIQYRQQYIVRNETLPEKYTDSEQVARWMPTQRYHITSRVAPTGYVSKCIVNPMKVMVMHVHFVEKFFGNFTLYEAKPEEMVVRHYRWFDGDKEKTDYLQAVEGMGKFSSTVYPKKWMAKLKRNVQERIHYVYGTV